MCICVFVSLWLITVYCICISLLCVRCFYLCKSQLFMCYVCNVFFLTCVCKCSVWIYRSIRNAFDSVTECWQGYGLKPLIIIRKMSACCAGWCSGLGPLVLSSISWLRVDRCHSFLLLFVLTGHKQTLLRKDGKELGVANLPTDTLTFSCYGN